MSSIAEYEVNKFAATIGNDINYIALIDRNKKHIITISHPTNKKHYLYNCIVLMNWQAISL